MTSWCCGRRPARAECVSLRTPPAYTTQTPTHLGGRDGGRAEMLQPLLDRRDHFRGQHPPEGPRVAVHSRSTASPMPAS